MPSFDSFIVGEDFVSEHFFTTDTTKAGESFQSEVLKLRKQWDDTSNEGNESPLDRFRKARGQLQIDLGTLAEEPDNASRVYRDLRQALGFQGTSTTFKAERSGAELLAHNVWSSPNNDVLFVEDRHDRRHPTRVRRLDPFRHALLLDLRSRSVWPYLLLSHPNAVSNAG